MNNDLLDANCVIQHLTNFGMILHRQWTDNQINPPDYSEYAVYFNNPNNNGDIRLQIITRSGRHLVSSSIIKILSHRHHFNADVIFTNCAIVL